MTILVPLSVAVQTTVYDEIAVFASALSASQVADHYAGASISYTQDPQDALGWEEVYGGDYPLTAGDVPVLQNGLCRVRYVPSTLSYAIDAFLAGIGWQEQGRVTTWFDDSGNGSVYTQQGALQSAQVVEWTAERAVLQVTTAVTVSGTAYRMETYISLQRGWTGPRFEVYPSPRAATKLGTRIVFTSYSNTVLMLAPGGGVTTDPWEAWIGGARSAYITTYRTVDTLTSLTDSVAYAVARPALAVATAQNTTGVGYGSVRLGFGPRGLYQEGELGATLSGSASLVADGAASGGQAVEETATAEAATLSLSTQQISRIPLGKYQLWARVRVVTGGATGTMLAFFSGTGASGYAGSVTFTNTTFAWVYIGEHTKMNADNALRFDLWRTAGTGALRIDQIAAVPVERRLAADPAYDGVRDLAVENLYDSRAVPELVTR